MCMLCCCRVPLLLLLPPQDVHGSVHFWGLGKSECLCTLSLGAGSAPGCWCEMFFVAVCAVELGCQCLCTWRLGDGQLQRGHPGPWKTRQTKHLECNFPQKWQDLWRAFDRNRCLCVGVPAGQCGCGCQMCMAGCTLQPGWRRRLPDVHDSVGCVLVLLQGAIPRSMAVCALELVGSAADCRCQITCRVRFRALAKSLCDVRFGAWVLVPLQGCCRMSMAACVLEPACWCRFRPLQGAAARCFMAVHDLECGCWHHAL